MPNSGPAWQHNEQTARYMKKTQINSLIKSGRKYLRINIVLVESMRIIQALRTELNKKIETLKNT